MSAPYGKHLPSIKLYAELLMPIDFPNDESLINRYGIVSELGIDLVMPVATSIGHYRFMPGPEFSPRLYRGQNQLFKKCVPSIFRKSEVQALYWVAKHIELACVMERHPATIDLMNHQIAGSNFSLSIEAIAQHYQYPTELLDFSRSRDVALFFATCKYDEKGDTYSPIQSGTGVVYTVNLRELILQRDGQGSLLPLGLEPLPRPDAQRALALRLRANEDLNNMQWAQHEMIEITPALSQHYFEMFEGGKKLFPHNPFDDHISRLRNNSTVPLQSLEFGLEKGLLKHPAGIKGLCKELTAAGFAVNDLAVDIDEGMILAAAEEWAMRKKDYFSRIRVRLASNHSST